MQIQFNSKNTNLDSEIKKYARKKVSRALRFCGKCGSIHIDFQEDPHHNQGENSKKISLTMYVPRDVIRLEEAGNDFKEAIDLIAPKLKLQIKKYHEKQETIARKNGRKFKNMIRSAMGMIMPSHKKGEYIPKYDIVRRKEFSIAAAIDEDKAIEEMEKLGHDFYAFIDSKSGQNSLAYKRKSGGYGVIKLKI